MAFAPTPTQTMLWAAIAGHLLRNNALSISIHTGMLLIAANKPLSYTQKIYQG